MKRRISISIDENLVEGVDRIANGRKRSTVISEIIREHLEARIFLAGAE